MRFGNLLRVLQLLVLTVLTSSPLMGQVILEDFEDGSITDGSPANWKRYGPPFDKGDVIIQNGSLVITPPTSGTPSPNDPNTWETDVYLQDRTYHDVNILTQVRALGDFPTAIGINAIDTDAVNYPGGSGVFGLLVNDGPDRYLDLSYSIGTSGGTFGQVDTDLILFDTEVNMRLTIQGEQVTFTVWEVASPEPAPQFVRQLPSALRNHFGYMGLYSIGRNQPAPAAFRYVTIVPEPTTGGLGLACGLAVLCRGRRRR
ncbi:MAG: hypothetical protein U0795_09825 [Pirellulales bacterium]